MTLGIMQPYFFPYIEYFQLIAAVDTFVVYDKIEFSKGGWINRNRILVNGQDRMISLPLKKDSDYLHVADRFLADDFNQQKNKLLAQLKGAYSKSPFFKEVFPVIEECFHYTEKKLFSFIFHSLQKTCNYIGLTTQLVASSTINFDNNLDCSSALHLLFIAKLSV